MAAALLLIVPLGILFVNWLGTLAFGSIELRAPMLFALGAISTLSMGLVAELLHAVIPVNWLLADTADATAATGYVLVGGAVMGGFAALYYWFPKMTGRTMGESLGTASFALILIGAHLTFLPMFLAGLEGQPVDVYKYYDTGNLGTLNLISSLGSLILAGGIVLTLVNLYRASPAAPAPGTTRGTARPSSGWPSRRPRRTTSTSSPTSAAPSRCATSATRSATERRPRRPLSEPGSSEQAESGEPVA